MKLTRVARFELAAKFIGNGKGWFLYHQFRPLWTSLDPNRSGKRYWFLNS